jgi:flavin reductase (DIM6/NTAB) family NADH-FMN oxidoreductase RutF
LLGDSRLGAPGTVLSARLKGQAQDSHHNECGEERMRKPGIRGRVERHERGTVMEVGPGGFGELVDALDYPMLVVTAAMGGDPAGCLVGFHTQCSLSPPRYLVCVSRHNHTFPVAAGSDLLAVHFLDAAQADLAALFGQHTEDRSEKFTACAWRWHRGVPLLTAARTWLLGRILDRVGFGDHVGHLLEPLEAHLERPWHQLAFQRVKTMPPGHS